MTRKEPTPPVTPRRSIRNPSAKRRSQRSAVVPTIALVTGPPGSTKSLVSVQREIRLSNLVGTPGSRSLQRPDHGGPDRRLRDLAPDSATPGRDCGDWHQDRDISSRSAGWKSSLAALRRDARTVALLWGHPRVRWYTRALAVLVLAYAASPIDLIPDFIPVLGLLDDLLLVPIGVWLVLRSVPPDVVAECRVLARESEPVTRWGVLGAVLVVAGWGAAAVITWWIAVRLRRAS